MSDQSDDLKTQRDRFVAFAFAAADLLVEVDQEGVIKYASGAGKGILSKSAGDLVGKTLTDFVAKEDQDFLQVVTSRVKPGVRMDPVPLQMTGTGGAYRRTIVSGFSLPTGKAGRYFLAISLADRLPKTIVEQDQRDRATGMLTKEAFVQAARERTRVSNSQEEEEALSFLVIKGLEKLAHTHGQEAVDRFMRKLTARLKASSIAGDTVGLLGEDRLGVLHDQGITQEDLEREAMAVAWEMEEETGQAVEVESFSVDLSVPGMSEEDASRAMMYAVKKFSDSSGGEFRVTSLQDGAKDLLNDTLKRVAQLRQTIAARAFEIVYQPIVDLDLRQVHHYEALTRFESNKSPQATIQFAEEVGLIEDFDLLLAQRVLEVLVEQQGMGFSPTVAINLSARSLNSDVWVKSLSQVVQPFSSVRKQLAFEVTETSKVEDFARFNKILQLLRKAGHTVCLDDVGQGSTSFQSLDLLQVDMVKIDGMYIQNASKSQRQMSMLKSIVALCKDLNVRMVAEMIDTERQVKDLRLLGVEFGQGYLFAKPRPEFLHGDELTKARKRKGEEESWM